ncbi:MAG: YihY/virulence factor BrkB family protein [Candidatus Latescibacterota bacterium]|nr:MAG: YihY/virulence factor BrkB family protein [Candidatus Latescibacterota bacterium]
MRDRPTMTPRDIGKGASRAVTLFAQGVAGLGRAVQRAWDGFFERRVPMMAAGLAFYFLLGLVPFLFLVAATSGYFLSTSPGILDQINVTLLEILPPGIGEKLLTEIQSAASNWEALGALALVSLILVAMGLFDGLDEGINAVMGTKKKVGFLKGRIISFAYIVGAILFFSVAAVAGYSLKLFETIPFFQRHPALIEILGKYFSVWVFAVFLLALYMTLPVKTPKLLHAIIVALAVTGAWSILQRLGTYITAGISRRQAIYGALAGAAVFLTWMYLLAILILLGARILDFWRGSSVGSPTDADEYM